jgi:CRP/FNR family cyclic AMP-dependent transcriptional regulator
MNQSSFFSTFFGEHRNAGNNGWTHIQTCPAGTQVYQQGASADTVYLVERGVVKLTRLAPNGREMIAGIRRRHWLIGTTAVLLRRPHSFTVTALVQTVVRCIPASIFVNLVKMDSQLSWQLNLLLSQEILNHRKRLEANSCMTARESLECFLCELINEQEPEETGKPFELLIPLKSQELAEIIAVTPEHLSRLLKEMEKDGVIRREKGMLIVSDLKSLLQKEVA